MLAVADSAQQGFFDSSWCGNVVPRDSFFGLLAEHGERIVCDGDFADCYSERRGRHSIPPSTLAKILLLAYRCGLSDRQAMEAVRFDLRWKVALGLPLDHEGFHPTSLVKFRARLLLHGKERVVFERSLELASELGLLSGPVEQILDSTPMLGAAAVQDTVTLVRSGVRKLLDAVKGADSRAARELRRGLRFDYSRPRVKPEGEWQERAARMELLAEVARDAERALRAVEADDELLAAPAIAEAVSVLREIIGQEFAVADDECPARAWWTARAPDRLRPRSGDAPRPPDLRAPLHRLQAARGSGERGADPDCDLALSRQRARRPASGSARRPAAGAAAPAAGDRRHRLRQRRGPRAARATLDLRARACSQQLAQGG